MAYVAKDKSETIRKVPLACADEPAAIEFMESVRWGEHPACPRCGDENVYQMTQRGSNERNSRYLWRCRGCAKQFTVRIGTVMEDSPIPVRHWVFAFWAASASKKGVSALQIKRQTGLSYKSALFLMHRVRWAMNHTDAQKPPLDGDVEADETYVGGKPRKGRKPTGRRHKHSGRLVHYAPQRRPDFDKRNVPVVAVLQRDGDVRTRVMTEVNGENLYKMLKDNVARTARLHTDEHHGYRTPGRYFDGGHFRVKHSDREYARQDGDVHVTTNTVEAFFALLKRGVIGTFHSVSRKHLHRYASEFAFRWNTRKLDDGGRLEALIQGGEGARLTYAEQVG